MIAERPPTGALRPPVAIGPADEDDDFVTHYGVQGAGSWELPGSQSIGSTGGRVVGGSCGDRYGDRYGPPGESSPGRPLASGDSPRGGVAKYATAGGGHYNQSSACPGSYDNDAAQVLGDQAGASRRARTFGGLAALNATPGEKREGFVSNVPGQLAPAPSRASVMVEAARPSQATKAITHASSFSQPPTVPVVPQRVAAVPVAAPAAQPLKVAEHWAASYVPPSARTATVTYPSGALVNFRELAPILAPLAAANAPHRARIMPAIESGDLVRQTLQIYQASDRDLTGFLSWNNGEIRNFIASVFRQHGLSPPNEHQMYQLYAKFDADKNSVLDARECLCLVDALFRSVFYVDGQAQPAGGCMGAPSFPPLPVLAGAFQAAPPVVPVPLPAMPGPQLQPMPAQVPPMQPPPPGAMVFQPPMGIGVSPPLVAAPPRPVALPRMPVSPEVPEVAQPVLSGAGASCRVPVAAMVPTPPMHSYDIAHQFEDVAGPAVGGYTPPMPPAWQDEQEQRPHLLEVDLEELELQPGAADMEASWYHTVKYFVSLHPRSENPESIPLPRDAPKATVAGQYLVSKVLAPTTSKLKVGGGASRTARGDSGEDSASEEGRAAKAAMARRRDGANPVVEFQERMSLAMSKLDQHLVAYIWGKKSSMMDESITLIGRALAPLHDFNLQRKSTTWGVFDVFESHRVADMQVRYSVATTPSSVQEPVVVERHQTEVKVVWTPPLNDHGAPIIGYKVSILIDAKANEDFQWFTLCDCTKSLNPVYVVANLKGNKAYVLDIRAMNKVGPGDPCEFQVCTAPVEPDPPSKPWIEEARDGCVNVAWHPPAADGGCPITAYKVRMRKILGASKWNPFGPGESKATWVDMGSVGAATSEAEEDCASVYNAWLGPLEVTACEYRFQIVAANHAGESAGSELSNPIYT